MKSSDKLIQNKLFAATLGAVTDILSPSIFIHVKDSCSSNEKTGIRLAALSTLTVLLQPNSSLRINLSDLQ